MNSPVPRGIDTGIARLAALNRMLATGLFVLLTGVVALQVFTRFVLHLPLIWSEELARFLFFWVVLLGAAMSVKDRRHFVIDVTAGRRPRAGGVRRFLFDVIPDLCVLGFSVLLLVEGLAYAHVGLFRIGSNSQINMAVVYAAIPVFAALSIVYAAGNLVVDWTALVQGRGAMPRPPPTAD